MSGAVHNFPPGDLTSGVLGNPDYEIDSMLPSRGFVVRVQLYKEAAEDVVYAAWPLGLTAPPEVGTDAFLDELTEVIRDWVATFPLPK